MSHGTPRKPIVGSRTPASAPRRIAGRDAAREAGRDVEPDDPEATPAEDAVELPVAEEPDLAAPDSPAPAGGALHRSRTTTVLAAVLGILLLAGVAELLYLLDEPERPSSSYSFEAGEPYEVPENPISIPLVEWRNANQAAGDAVKEILTVSWKNYDEHLDDVGKLMTDRFAEEYTATATDSRDKFLESKAEYEFAVVGSSVVHAAEDEVTSLLFLNQFVYKGEGKKRVGPEVYQVRVIVTTTRDGDGDWLVSDLDAQ